MNIIVAIGDVLLKAADYIYSLTSSVLGGEEEVPEELVKKVTKRHDAE